MQLIGVALALCALGGPAAACDVAISTPGLLKLSGSGQTLGSGNANGVPMLVVVSNLNVLSPTTITISNIRLDTTPAGFAAPVTYEGTYSATWLLTGSSGSIAPQAQFTVPAILNLVVSITLNNTVTSTTGFKQGNYSTKTTITCS